MKAFGRALLVQCSCRVARYASDELLNPRLGAYYSLYVGVVDDVHVKPCGLNPVIFLGAARELSGAVCSCPDAEPFPTTKVIRTSKWGRDLTVRRLAVPDQDWKLVPGWRHEEPCPFSFDAGSMKLDARQFRARPRVDSRDRPLSKRAVLNRARGFEMEEEIDAFLHEPRVVRGERGKFTRKPVKVQGFVGVDYSSVSQRVRAEAGVIAIP